MFFFSRQKQKWYQITCLFFLFVWQIKYYIFCKNSWQNVSEYMHLWTLIIGDLVSFDYSDIKIILIIFKFKCDKLNEIYRHTRTFQFYSYCIGYCFSTYFFSFDLQIKLTTALDKFDFHLQKLIKMQRKCLLLYFYYSF